MKDLYLSVTLTIDLIVSAYLYLRILIPDYKTDENVPNVNLVAYRSFAIYIANTKIESIKFYPVIKTNNIQI